MSSEKVIKEKNKILSNDVEDENYDCYNSDEERDENNDLENEYYLETINTCKQYLLNYSEDNYLSLCEFLNVVDIENFLEINVLK